MKSLSKLHITVILRKCSISGYFGELYYSAWYSYTGSFSTQNHPIQGECSVRFQNKAWTGKSETTSVYFPRF